MRRTTGRGGIWHGHRGSVAVYGIGVELISRIRPFLCCSKSLCAFAANLFDSHADMQTSMGTFTSPCIVEKNFAVLRAGRAIPSMRGTMLVSACLIEL